MESSDDESSDGFAQGGEKQQPPSSATNPTADAMDSGTRQSGDTVSNATSFCERGALVQLFGCMEISAVSSGASAELPPVVHLGSDISSVAFQPDNQEGVMGYLDLTEGGGFNIKTGEDATATKSSELKCKSGGNGDHSPLFPVGSTYRFIPLSQKVPRSLIDHDPITSHVGATKNNDRFLEGMACNLAVGDKCRFCCEGRFDWEGFITRIDSRDPTNIMYYGDFSHLPHFVASWNEKPYPRHKVSKFFVPDDTADLDHCLVRGHPLTYVLTNRYRMKKGVLVLLCDGSKGKVYYNDPVCWRIGVKFDDTSRFIHRMSYLKVTMINPTQNYLASYSAHLALEKVTPPGRKRTAQGFESGGSAKGAKTPKSSSTTPSSSKTPQSVASKSSSSKRSIKSLESSLAVGDSRPWATSSQPMGERAPYPTGMTWLERKRMECHVAVKGVLDKEKAKGVGSGEQKKARAQSMDVDPQVDNDGQDQVAKEKDKEDSDWTSKLADLRKLADETITKPIIAAMVAQASASPTVNMQTPPSGPKAVLPLAPTKAKARLDFDPVVDKTEVVAKVVDVAVNGSDNDKENDNEDNTDTGVVKKRPAHSAISSINTADDVSPGTGSEPKELITDANKAKSASSEGDITESTEQLLESKEATQSSDISSDFSMLQMSSSASHGQNAKESNGPTTFSLASVEFGRPHNQVEQERMKDTEDSVEVVQPDVVLEHQHMATSEKSVTVVQSDVVSDEEQPDEEQQMTTSEKSVKILQSDPATVSHHMVTPHDANEVHADGAKADAAETTGSASFTEASAKNLDYRLKLPLTSAMIAPVRAYLSKPKMCVLSSTQKPGSSQVLSKLYGGVMVGPLSCSPIRMEEDGDTNDAFEKVNQSFMGHSFEDESNEEEFCPIEVIYDDHTKGRRSLNVTTVQKIWENNPLMRFDSNVEGVCCLRLTVGSIVWVNPAFGETNLEHFVPAAVEASSGENEVCAKLEVFLSHMVHDFFKPYPTPMELAYNPCAAKLTKRKRTKDLALDHRPPFEQMVSVALKQSSFDGIAVNDIHGKIVNVMGKLQKKLSNAARFARLTFLGLDPKASAADVDFE